MKHVRTLDTGAGLSARCLACGCEIASTDHFCRNCGVELGATKIGGFSGLMSGCTGLRSCMAKPNSSLLVPVISQSGSSIVNPTDRVT